MARVTAANGIWAALNSHRQSIDLNFTPVPAIQNLILEMAEHYDAELFQASLYIEPREGGAEPVCPDFLDTLIKFFSTPLFRGADSDKKK